MIRLYHDPGSASMVPHVLLEEIGTPFELKRVPRAQARHKTPEYLALNPNGLIPVLVDADLVLYETAAICLYLADRFPHAALAPPPGASAPRAHFQKWLVWLTNTLQAMLLHCFYPQRMVDDGDAAAAAQVQAHARSRVGGMLEQLDAQLASHGKPWLLGEHYSAVDPYAFTLCRWTRGFDTRPARDYPQLGPYLQRMLQRPALQRALHTEGLAPPFV